MVCAMPNTHPAVIDPSSLDYVQKVMSLFIKAGTQMFFTMLLDFHSSKFYLSLYIIFTIYLHLCSWQRLDAGVTMPCTWEQLQTMPPFFHLLQMPQLA